VLVAGLHNVRTHRPVASTYILMCTMSHWSVVVRRCIPGPDYARRARPSQSTSLIFVPPPSLVRSGRVAAVEAVAVEAVEAVAAAGA